MISITHLTFSFTLFSRWKANSEPGKPSEDAQRLQGLVPSRSHVSMSHQQHYHGRAMSSEERSLTPINKTSTPVHKSASSSSSSQRDSRQVGNGSGERLIEPASSWFLPKFPSE